MPTLGVPGVYIDEVTGPGVITGVGTSTAAFVGPALNGDVNKAIRVSSFDEFLAKYGIPQGGISWPYKDSLYMPHGVRGFFENGGAQAYIVRIGTGDDPTSLNPDDYKGGLKFLEAIDDVNLICIPDAAAHKDCGDIQKKMIDHCIALKDRFAILDSPSGADLAMIEQHRGIVQSEKGFAALYYPWVEVLEPIHPSKPRPAIPPTTFVPPSGHLAGVFARMDNERGVHKAPANTEVRGVRGLEQKLSDGEQGPLNLKGINVLRIFPGSAQVIVWGARTTVDPIVTDWLYVNVRRLMLYIEESIEEGIRWAIFEPNNLALWQKLKRTITEFLTRVWRDGALFGDTADKAFYVRIDEALNPPSALAIGQLHIEIGVCPVRPAEFIIVRIGLWDGGSKISEG
jgi:Bacteriophage tail sheath protein